MATGVQPRAAQAGTCASAVAPRGAGKGARAGEGEKVAAGPAPSRAAPQRRHPRAGAGCREAGGCPRSRPPAARRLASRVGRPGTGTLAERGLRGRPEAEARGGEGWPQRTSLTSRPDRRTYGEGIRAHAGPRRAWPRWAASPPGYRCRPARPGLARPRLWSRARAGGVSCRQAGARVRRAAQRQRLRGTLGITAWTCVCVCARPEALCTTRACVCRLGFVKLHPRPLCVCFSAC